MDSVQAAVHLQFDGSTGRCCVETRHEPVDQRLITVAESEDRMRPLERTRDRVIVSRRRREKADVRAGGKVRKRRQRLTRELREEERQERRW